MMISFFFSSCYSRTVPLWAWIGTPPPVGFNDLASVFVDLALFSDAPIGEYDYLTSSFFVYCSDVQPRCRELGKAPYVTAMSLRTVFTNCFPLLEIPGGTFPRLAATSEFGINLLLFPFFDPSHLSPPFLPRMFSYLKCRSLAIDGISLRDLPGHVSSILSPLYSFPSHVPWSFSLLQFARFRYFLLVTQLFFCVPGLAFSFLHVLCQLFPVPLCFSSNVSRLLTPRPSLHLMPQSCLGDDRFPPSSCLTVWHAFSVLIITQLVMILNHTIRFFFIDDAVLFFPPHQSPKSVLFRSLHARGHAPWLFPSTVVFLVN